MTRTRTTIVSAVALAVVTAGYARAAPERVALLQLDAYLADAHNEAVVVREAADRIARAKNPDVDPTLLALDGAVTNLMRQVAVVQKQGPSPRFADAGAAAADVDRDWRALHESIASHEVAGVRGDSDHLLQALARLDRALDPVFHDAGIDRLRFVAAQRSLRR